jgi:serine/threonine protein kinase
MGAVYEAEQISLGRRVALKVLFDDDEQSLARFKQEGRALAQLAHPNIVAVLDFYSEPGEPPVLAMDLLQGESLHALLLRDRALPPERATAIAAQILEALEAAHAQSILHRDIKPSNVFLVRDARGREVVKLLDFGIAKVLDGGVVNTTLGTLVGTTSYLAPERLRGEAASVRSDVYSVGICLFEMLAGRKPWRARPGPQLDAEILTQPPLTLSEVGADVPRGLTRVIERAMASDPMARYASARRMVDDLRRRSAAVVADPNRAARREDRRRSFAVLAALGVIASTAFVAAVLMRTTPPAPPPLVTSAAPTADDPDPPDIIPSAAPEPLPLAPPVVSIETPPRRYAPRAKPASPRPVSSFDRL